MGKGVIVGGGEDGLYDVRIIYNLGDTQKRIENLQKLIDECDAKIAEIQPQLSEFDAEIWTLKDNILTLTHDINDLNAENETLLNQIESLQEDLDSLDPDAEYYESQKAAIEAEITSRQNTIDSNQSTIDSKQATINDNSQRIQEIVVEYQRVDVRRRSIVASKLSYQTRQYALNRIPTDKLIEDVWCADLTENIEISKEVGIIEVPGESRAFNIQPAFNPDNVTYNQTRDGQLMQTLAMTPAQAYYNLAMMPGWQKWKPTYRYGTITFLDTDNDKASVSVEQIPSSQQGININQSSVLYEVPIVYMNCNAEAFKEGDEVLIKFENQNFANPKIIGFKEEPQPCWILLTITVTDCEDSSLLEGVDVDLIFSNKDGTFSGVTDSDGTLEVQRPAPSANVDITLSLTGYNTLEDSFALPNTLFKEFCLTKDDGGGGGGDGEERGGFPIYAVLWNTYITSEILSEEFIDLDEETGEPIADMSVRIRVTRNVNTNYITLRLRTHSNLPSELPSNDSPELQDWTIVSSCTRTITTTIQNVSTFRYYGWSSGINTTLSRVVDDVGETKLIGIDDGDYFKGFFNGNPLTPMVSSRIKNDFPDLIRVEGIDDVESNNDFMLYLSHDSPILYGNAQQRGLFSYDTENNTYSFLPIFDIPNDFYTVRQGNIFGFYRSNGLFAGIDYANWPELSETVKA